MRAAHALGCRCLPKYSSKFSRHDFTLPQLFACLVVREQVRLSYRGAEALLRDGRAWCRAIGMRRRTPDHATLARAAKLILDGRRITRMLDLLAEWFTLARASSASRWRSIRRVTTCTIAAGITSRAAATTTSADATTARETRGEVAVPSARPRLSVGVDTRSHVILSASARTGMCSDAPSFDGLLYHAWRRRGRRVKQVLADRPAQAAGRSLPPADEVGAERLTERQTVRTTGGDGDEHVEADPRRRAARPLAADASARARVQGRGA